MNVKMITTAAAAAVLFHLPAQAASVPLSFSGSGITTSLVLTTIANPNTGMLGTSPNTVDPIGSQIVTGITGTFSDANIGLTDVAITGIVASSPANPNSTNLLAPHSFGFYDIASGLSTPEGPAPGFSYDGLFYPAGSPQAASSYPFSGGVFDIYGIVFTLAGGDAVDLWSNGDLGSGVTYGAGVTDGLTLLDYASPLAAVPEPSSWTMLLSGFAVVGGLVRRRRLQPKLVPALARA
jgi:hypothetical protein